MGGDSATTEKTQIEIKENEIASRKYDTKGGKEEILVCCRKGLVGS